MLFVDHGADGFCELSTPEQKSVFVASIFLDMMTRILTREWKGASAVCARERAGASTNVRVRTSHRSRTEAIPEGHRLTGSNIDASVVSMVGHSLYWFQNCPCESCTRVQASTHIVRISPEMRMVRRFRWCRIQTGSEPAAGPLCANGLLSPWGGSPSRLSWAAPVVLLDFGTHPDLDFD